MFYVCPAKIQSILNNGTTSSELKTFVDLLGRLYQEKDYTKRKDSLVTEQPHPPVNNSVLSLPLTQKFCVAMGKSFQPTVRFPQHCFQALNVRQRVWWHSVFRGWLTAVSGRCRWVINSSKTWKSTITLSYKLFWLFRENRIIWLHLVFPGGEKKKKRDATI